MNRALVDQIVHAVLYEGYILYPYRASARKNRQRFTFGRVYPEAYSAAQHGAEPSAMQTQCLAEIDPAARDPALEISVRFLHPMARVIGALLAPLRELPPPGVADFFTPVPELEIDGHLHQSWQEAVEREVRAPAQNISAASSLRVPFSFPASREFEPIRNTSGEIAAVILRRQEAVEGLLEISLESLAPALRKITVRILNRTAMPAAALDDSEAVLMRTFASTHTILSVHAAAFVSQIDPPPAHAAAAAACRQIGTWPVLVGDETKHERDTIVSSPIILYDYPKIAPESPGDLFDGGEIDEILTLRIQTLTDAEKKEMRGIDAHARRILERTENLQDKQLLGLHGAMRGNGPPGPTAAAETESFFNPATKLTSFSRDGISVKTGDRVRVRPKSRADIMDIALDGKIAVIEAIEQDAEDRLHLALVIEDDPGKDLGYLRQPGHRFFYTIDEVELLREGA